MAVKRTIDQGFRASEIATVLWNGGFRWLVAALGLQSCVSVRCRIRCSAAVRQCTHHAEMELPLAERTRIVLERLGPTFVKFGQMLALRPDYVPPEFARALRQLHADVAPFPGAEARSVVERELGRPLRELFADFEPEPFAAASLSQVHRAALPDGRAVAVKVQRPGIEHQIDSDLGLLAFLARRLEARRPAQTLGFRPSAAVAELDEYTRRELDFRLEARTCRRLGQAFAGRDDVVIPWVDQARTTARVLTMELIDGTPPAPAAELAELGFAPDKLLRTGAEVMVSQLFDIGLFHADPHPGNILFLPGDRVCLLDFGMFGRLRPRDRRHMGFLLWSLMEGDYEILGDLLLNFAELAPGARPDQFRDALDDVVEDWYAGENAGGSIAHLLWRQLALGARFGVIFPRELMLVGRALVGIDATTTLIAPDVPFRDLVEPLIPQLRETLIPKPGQLKEALERRRFDYMQLLLDLPDALPELAARLRTPSDGAVTSPAAQRAPAAAAGALAGFVAGAALGRR